MTARLAERGPTLQQPMLRSLLRLALPTLLAASLFLHLPAARAAEQKSVEKLEQVFTQEKDARKRARLALEILQLRLDALRAFVATGTMLQANSLELTQYDAAVTRLEETVNAASHAPTSKRIELGLREQMKDLEQVRMNVSSEERPRIEALAARIVKLREAVLYGLMAPKKK